MTNPIQARKSRGVLRLTMIPLLFALTCVINVEVSALESGELIPVGAENGIGPLAAHAVITEPVGSAYLSNADEPDIFIRTGRFGHKKGLFLFPFHSRGSRGEPLFGAAERIGHPFDTEYPPAGYIVQTGDKTVHALWLAKGGVLHATFDSAARRFEERNTIDLAGLPRSPRRIGAAMSDGGSVSLLLSISDGTPYRDWKGSTRDPEYDPYDGRGIWRGGLPYVGMYAVDLPKAFEGPATNPRRVSQTNREVRSQYAGFVTANLGDGHERDIITGSHFGEFHAYPNESHEALELAPRRHLVDAEGVALRHPTIHPTPVAYPNPATGWTDIIAGGEGGLYWYRFIGRFNETSKPEFDPPLPVLETDAALYAGTLPVTNVVDWDGDGDQDIVAGNSEGFILFFENNADDKTPQFLPGVRLHAGGEAIHVQPGYRLDIQGPNEARWGYVCPTVVDWDRDGLLDIVMSDSTARHTFFHNIGQLGKPVLASGKPIYYDGLELFGTWRVQPAAGLLGDRMAYIALDDDDAFHLYWQEDRRHVTDGGKLQLETGENIRANFLSGGGTGRLKLVLYDWDRDGKKDLIVGTPRHGSVPNPESGLPQSLGLPGSSVLFLRNTGSNEQPQFAFPELFAFRGDPLFLGQHACSPALADFGDKDGPGLIVGEESGRMLYYAREDLTTITAAAWRQRQGASPIEP